MSLDKARPAAECLVKSVQKDRPLNVLELCSGSGSLLFSLDRLGALGIGFGVEVSPSRHRFAEKWKAAVGTSRIHNILSSVQSYVFPDIELDAVVVIDGALGYLYASDPQLPGAVLKSARERLTSDGIVMIKLDLPTQDKLIALRRDGHWRDWCRSDDRDSGSYALYQIEAVDWDHRVVKNTSIYLSRNGSVERVKREFYKYFAIDELDGLLAIYGFNARYYGNYGFDAFDPNGSAFVGIAR